MAGISGIDVNLVVALDALLQEGSVVGAARKIGLSQPAMSHALAKLRLELGDPLLVRVGRGMVPTPRAVALRGPAREAMERLETLFRDPPAFEPATSTRCFVVAATRLRTVGAAPAPPRAPRCPGPPGGSAGVGARAGSDCRCSPGRIAGAGGGAATGFGGWSVSDGRAMLELQNSMYRPEPLAVGDEFDAMAGVLQYSFGAFKLEPRRPDDLVPVSAAER